MRLVDVAMTGAVVVQAVYAAATYHRDRAAQMQGKALSGGSRPFLVIVLLMITTWAAVAYDIYDRRSPQHLTPNLRVLSWGVASVAKDQPPLYTIILDTSGMGPFKDKFNLILLARNNWGTVDPMKDSAIEKSTPYSILLPSMIMQTAGAKKIIYASGQPNNISMIVAMIPTSVATDDIRDLGDVSKNGGKILASVGEVVTGGAPMNLSAAPPK